MSSKSITCGQLAKRYVSALLAQAQETHDTDTVGKELETLATLDAECPEFHMLLSSAVLPKKEKEQALQAVCEKLDLSDLMRRFLGVLNENGRLSLLSEIERKYARRRAQADGALFVKVTSAMPLNEKLTRRLNEVLFGIYHKKICLEVFIDESLIAGLSIQVGSVLVDGSLKTKLQKLNQVMKGVG